MSSSNGARQQPAEKQFHCPMHPTYVSDRAGSCPICGMDLVPIEDGGVMAGAPTTAGRTTVFIHPDRRRQIGLTTTVVENKALTRALRASGTVEWNETRRVQVSPRVGGWVQELYADYEGRAVEKGQPLFKLYSPELLATQREYLQARATGEEAMIAAARRRLELWEIHDEQIGELERSNLPTDTLVIRAPASGVLREKKAFTGMAFMPGEMLFEIVDLSTMWVHAFLHEQDLPYVKTGLLASVAVEAFPNRLYSGRLGFIYPNVDEISRRVEVRLEVDNADGALRADMWATVEIDIDLGEGPVIPAGAAIDTGQRMVAFVERDDGHLEPREIRVGGRGKNELLVKKGLSAGERVVTRALFLVDSESQLKAAIAGMGEAGAHRP